MTQDLFNIIGGPAQPVAEQLAIQHLMNQYCHLVDRGSVEEIAALFSEDGVLLPLHEGEDRIVGRAAIRAWYRDYDDRVRANRRHRRHRITVPFVIVDGDRATAQSYLDSSAVLIDEGVINVSAGRYDDELVKVDGQWLFQERAIHINHIHKIPAFEENPE